MARIIIKMISTGKNFIGKSTGYFKTQTKNKISELGKRELKMFDPFCYDENKKKRGCHVLFKESKIK